MPQATPPQLPTPLPYDPAFEQIADGEAAAIAELQEVFVAMAQKVAQARGHALRAVHAKGQGLLRGRLEVSADLPPVLRQGLFAQAARYEVLMRFSSPPAEQLPDGVSTPRAVALKVLDVPGERVDGDAGSSQDFLMVNGPAFARPRPQDFLKDVKLLAATTEKAPRGKKLVSAVLRGAEAAIEAVGGESGKLKGLGGQPQVHPLGETFFSQSPFRYGPYMAKFSLAPVSPQLLELEGQGLDSDEDAQRDAIAAFFATGGGEWELRVQLCTDIGKMPIEDASVEWPQALSPFIAVAKLVVQPQPTWQGDATQLEEDALAFSPWNALAAHRPLGGVNRARRAVMAASRRHRSEFNRCPIDEPHAG